MHDVLLVSVMSGHVCKDRSTFSDGKNCLWRKKNKHRFKTITFCSARIGTQNKYARLHHSVEHRRCAVIVYRWAHLIFMIFQLNIPITILYNTIYNIYCIDYHVTLFKRWRHGQNAFGPHTII